MRQAARSHIFARIVPLAVLEPHAECLLPCLLPKRTRSRLHMLCTCVCKVAMPPARAASCCCCCCCCTACPVPQLAPFHRTSKPAR